MLKKIVQVVQSPAAALEIQDGFSLFFMREHNGGKGTESAIARIFLRRANNPSVSILIDFSYGEFPRDSAENVGH